MVSSPRTNQLTTVVLLTCVVYARVTVCKAPGAKSDSASPPPKQWSMMGSFAQLTAFAESMGKQVTRKYKALNSSPAETVRFDLFTRAQPTNPTRIFARDKASLESSTFDPKKPTKILLHGFLSHQGPGTGGDALKNAFLTVEDCNVVTVDWSEADPQDYLSAVKFALPRVGDEVAELLRLMCSAGSNPANFHLLGHSLGGQMAGAAGRQVLGRAGAGRITGLDPAGPLFEGWGAGQRLSSPDAGFVDIVHTDGGYLGFEGPTGHVDFFPNGGKHILPGCGKDLIGLCSHCLAYDYIIDSILRPGETAFSACPSWSSYQKEQCTSNETAFMGMVTDPRARGTFFATVGLPVRESLQKYAELNLFSLIAHRANNLSEDLPIALRC